jgi:hypothetical protein
MGLDAEIIIKDMIEEMLERTKTFIRYENLHIIIENNVVYVEDFRKCEVE